jgi:uncharacterized membrane protein
VITRLRAIPNRLVRYSEVNGMTKTHLEAFSDCVLSIIITILVLELKVPHSDELSALSRSCLRS